MRRTYSWTSRTAALAPCCSFDATLPAAPDEPQLAAFQLLHLVAQRRSLLELEVGGVRLHLRLQARDVGVELPLGLDLSGFVRRRRHRHVVALVHAAHLL